MIHAPEIDRPELKWLNTDQPIDLASLRGRVVVLDFWTYCCVNCLHVIPMLHDIEKRFAGRVVVIGVHSPKFTHERDLEHVREAIRRYDIHHPVIHDPDRRLWDEYAVKAWPTLILISADGFVVGHYPGEPYAAAFEAEIERVLAGVPPVETTALRQSKRNNSGESASGKSDTGAYLYPAKINRVPGTPIRWAMADTGHHQIVLLDDNGRELDRFGTGDAGFVDGGRGSAQLNGPEGICCTNGAIYVADTRNHAVRCIELMTGNISTVAGSGERGSPLPGYWSGSESVALASPWDLTFANDRLFVANAGTHQIIELHLKNGNVRLAAGNGREGIHDGPAHQAQLAQPSGLAYDDETEHLYFVDSETSSVRCLDLRQQWVDTLIGRGLFDFGDAAGPYSEARLQHPLGIAVCDGLIYIADSYNSSIKSINPAEQAVRQFDAGQFVCSDPLCIPLAEPAGISCAVEGRLMVVDTNNNRVVEYDLEGNTSRTWSPS